MEKLELKHLAPYLPYGLKYVNYSSIRMGLGKPLIGDINNMNIMGFIEGDTLSKPILKPLSDLTDRINPVQHHTYLDGLSFSKIEFVEKAICNETLFLCDYNYLIEYHFDVFGLIEKGLAIDKNKLAQLKNIL